MIPLSRPDVTEMEIAEVLSVLRTPVLSIGPKVREFEEQMAALLGVRHAVAVCNGTCGLHLAVRAVGVRDGMEVLTTPFSFVASSNVLLYERAVPVFVDIDEETLNLSPGMVEEAIERLYARAPRGLINRTTGRPLHALLPVDVFGHPIEIEAFRALARRHGLALIEDSCEALGSQVRTAAGTWVPAGNLADVSVFAFYPNKQMTTGEGGVIATNDDAVAAACRAARNQGRAEGATWLEHDMLGYNYRMDELSAALGVAQLRRFDELTAKRAAVAARYEAALAGIPGLEVPRAMPWARVNWFVYVVRLPEGIDREAMRAFLATRGVDSRAYFPAIHLQPFYRRELGWGDGAFPTCERVARRTLALPFFNDLREDQIGAIAQALAEGVEACAAATA